MKTLSLLLAFILTTMTIDSSFAESKMIATSAVVEGISLQHEREKIITFMQSEQISKQMANMGVDTAEAVKRVASLSAKEIRTLHKQIENAPAGADGGVGTIIGAVLLVFIVLLITDILGYTKVFPFTRAVQ
ncbi:MAG TPA: PA2779 family protein [Bacteriovoracaceae bacterium]|nr:PA2779 family protein [Bacteriovoracaceae bacterium]